MNAVAPNGAEGFLARYAATKGNLPGDSTLRAAAADVTGGMESKVKQMLDSVTANPEMTVQIFSGVEPGNIVRALTGEVLGTVIKA